MKARKSLSSTWQNSQADYGQILWKIMVFLIFSTLVSAQYPIENLTKSSQTGQACFTQACHFPFTHKGRTFNECTVFDSDLSDDERPWCAINEDQSYCSETNKPCQFPFFYEGKNFTECTMLFSYQEWCATEVYSNRTMKEHKWGYCGIDCPTGQGITYNDRMM